MFTSRFRKALDEIGRRLMGEWVEEVDRADLGVAELGDLIEGIDVRVR